MTMLVSPISLETVNSVLEGLAPDGGRDPIRTLGDVALNGLGQLSVSLAIPGATVVTNTDAVITNSATRATIVTPSAGRRVRVLGGCMTTNGATSKGTEVYFGTGASLPTDGAKGVFNGRIDVTDEQNNAFQFGDGSGPVGAVDEVLSVRCGTADAGETVSFLVHTRDE